MSRLERFELLKECPIRGKWHKKLAKKDYEFCVEFLKDNESLSKSDFEFKANRVFLDNPNKPKQWGNIWALLIEVSEVNK